MILIYILSVVILVFIMRAITRSTNKDSKKDFDISVLYGDYVDNRPKLPKGNDALYGDKSEDDTAINSNIGNIKPDEPVGDK